MINNLKCTDLPPTLQLVTKWLNVHSEIEQSNKFCLDNQQPYILFRAYPRFDYESYVPTEKFLIPEICLQIINEWNEIKPKDLRIRLFIWHITDPRFSGQQETREAPDSLFGLPKVHG